MIEQASRRVLPWVSTFTNVAAADDARGQAVFAWRLESCPVERPSELRPLQEPRLVSVDLLNALFAESPAPTYALRYIAVPGADGYGRGEIAVIFFAKATARTEEEASARATTLTRQIPALLGAFLPDFAWEPVTTSVEFERWWRPFGNAHLHFAAIVRREDLLTLETLRPRPSLGRGRTGPPPRPNENDAVYVVCPFLPRQGSRDTLLRALLLHSEPVLWQVDLRPVRLIADEEESLMNLIGRCEAYQQAEIRNLTPEIAGTVLAHLARARLLSALILDQLLRLQDAPFEMQVTLASPAPIPRGLVETAGVDLTLPLGGVAGSEWTGSLLRGGYDVAFAGSDADKKIAQHNFETLELDRWGESLAPTGLRRWRSLVDATEAAGAFRFPKAASDGIPGIAVHAANVRPLPREIAALERRLDQHERFSLGSNRYLGGHESVCIAQTDRLQHSYVVGQTGTGKSTLLKSMILSDIEQGRGVALIDPHGDLFNEVLNMIPSDRWDDVVLLDPADDEWSVGLNLLECSNEGQRHFVVREMRAIIQRLIGDQYANRAVDYAGPVFYQHLQMNMLLVMSDPDRPGTLLDFYEVFQGAKNWEKWTPLRWDDPQLRRWVQTNLPKIDYTRRDNENMCWGEYLSSKFEEFVFDPRLRRIFGQRRSTIDLRQIMDSGKILLVNLAKGQISEANSRFLGMVLMARLQAAAMTRLNVPVMERRRFFVYVDEFQSLATQNFTLLLSEARKFGVGLILANQFVDQVEEQIVRSILGNVGTLIAFRVGRQDARILAPLFAPQFEEQDLVNLPNWSAAVKTVVDGQIVSPFTLRTELPDRSADEAGAREISARSRKQHARPCSLVDAEIAAGSDSGQQSVVIDPI